MASVKHYQSDNKKYSSKSSRVNVNNPDFTPAIDVVGKDAKTGIDRNQERWATLISWCRWNIDGFYDLITPELGASIRLGLDQRVILRCLTRFKSTYCVLARGSGKCITGDSLLLTSDGIKEIGSYFNYRNDDKETIYSNDINIVNRYGKIEHSDKGIYSGRKPTIKITTNEGFSIEGTYVHPLLVMDKDGLLKYKKLSEIEINDFVCISRGNNIWGTNVNTDANDKVKEWYDSKKHYKRAALKKRELPSVITEDIAYYLGLLIGDGGLTTKNRINFSNIDKDVLKRFFDISQNVFGISYIRQCNKNDYSIYDGYLKKYLEFLGLSSDYGKNKKIPECILSAPKNIVKSFIMGLFDTDGCGEKHAISYCTASKQLAKQVQTILLNFGIVSKKIESYDKKGYFSVDIIIYGENVDIFNTEIGFSCNKKLQRAILLSDKKHNTNIDIIPYQQKLIKPIYYSLNSYNKRFLYHCQKGNNQLTYYRLNTLMSKDDIEDFENIEHFKELKNLKYFYSKVTNIEYSENDVYDLQVPITHSFVANGFVNHNTMLSMMYAFHTCIFYPNVQVSLTAQTRENSAKLIKDKYEELIRAFPLLKEEIYNAKFSKDTAEIEFHNGSKITNLANNQSSKGAHVQRGIVDEDNLTDEETYLDVLEPIFTTVPRRTVGKDCLVDPEEMNGSISQLTSSGFRGSSAFYRCIKHLDNMINLKGEMCFGASWELQTFYGRGATKAEILKKRDTNTAVSFDMNYRAVWTGNSDSALVSMSKLLSCRTLANAELKGNPNFEYVLGVDIARSDNDSNNQTSIAVLKVIRRKDGRVKEVQVVNIEAIKGTLDFNAQALELKRMKNKYNAQIIVIDENGLGRGNFWLQKQRQPRILGNQYIVVYIIYPTPQQFLAIPKAS